MAGERDDRPEKKIEKISLFYEISKTLGSTINLEEILNLAVDLTLRALNADTCSLMWLREDGLYFEAIGGVNGQEIQTLKQTPIKKDNPVVKDLLQNKKPLIVDDISHYPELRPFLLKKAARSFYIFPLMIRRKLIGLLTFGHKLKHALTDDELAILEIIVEHTVMAIRKGRLYFTVKEEREKVGKINEQILRMQQELFIEKQTLERKVDERTRDLKLATKKLLIQNEELQAQTNEIRAVNKELKRVSQYKSEFLANMSHELRTPLNSIIGFTGIILQGIVGKLNDEQKKQLNMVYDSAKHLLGLINDILDLSKIEAGKIEIVPSEFEVRGLIQTVEKMVSPMIEEKDLTLQVAISKDVPPIIYNDKNRIKQVLINLLSNATKFTESGKIRLTMEKVEGSDFELHRDWIQISVQDTGIGIKPEHLPDIFDEFKQIECPLKEKPAGTGLGLAISKKIVEMMEGRIWAESEYGKGSCFQFAIPIKEITTAKRPSVISPEALDLSKKLVLTIDDEVEAQEILTTYLKSEGYEVIQAYNAMEAMELAKKYRLFAITLDIIMTGKDGWDILHELKKDPQTKDVPVICISILDNREMGLSLGAIEYMVKPINKDQLTEELQRLKKRFRIYDILIIDDEPQAVELMTQYLGEVDHYTVRKAYGGEEGLLRIKESRPDLIILDLMMPEVDGFEVIRHLKKSAKTKDIPIIIVSAKKLRQEEIEYLNSNIEKIVRKGDFRKENLLKDIKIALDKIEG